MQIAPPTSACPRDQFDLPITGADSGAAAAYDAYVGEFLSYGANLRDLFAVADAFPGAPLLNAHAAALNLAFEGAEGWTAAQPYLRRMEAHAAGAGEREGLFCEATKAWAGRDFHKALALLDELTVRWPADLCAIKWGQYHAFNLGDAAALLRFGERARIVHEDAPYVHGLIAFGLEQNHRLDEAEAEGLRASKIAIDDAWAHHAVAHVMDARGRPEDGARWLDRCAHTWERKGVFIRDHNWWHAALFRLALGLKTEALSIYDRRLWGQWPEFPQEQIGAISMLWRLELHGVDTGDRWRHVVEQVRTRAGEHIFPFHDLHYLFALARAGDPGEADDFLDGMTARAAQSHGDAAKVWKECAAPAGKALLNFIEGDRALAGETLRALSPELYRIGGSHAQRQVFADTVRACEDPSWAASGRQF